MSGGRNTRLALDLAAASGAYDRVSELMRTVTSYVTGLEKLDLTPGHVFGSTFDPFERLPGLRQALQTARDHSGAWSGVGQKLLMSLFMSAHEMSSQLAGAAKQAGETVDAAKRAGRPLTKAEIDSIVATLRRLQGTLQSQRNRIEESRRESVDFVRLISGDYARLTTSAERLEKAIAWIDEWIVRVATSYISQPPLMNMVTEYGAAWRKKVVAANDAVHGLAGANDKAQSAVPGIIAAWVTVDGKFKAVIEALEDAAQAAKTADDIPDMLEIASDSWQDFLNYIARTHSAASLAA